MGQNQIQRYCGYHLCLCTHVPPGSGNRIRECVPRKIAASVAIGSQRVGPTTDKGEVYALL